MGRTIRRAFRAVTRVAGAVVGGVAGFTVGGPVGAALGAVGGWKAGGWVGDKVSQFAGTAMGGGTIGALLGAGAGALLGFTIGGPLGSAMGIGMAAMFGSQIGGTIGAKMGNQAHEARLREQLSQMQGQQFSNMGMPNMGYAGQMPGYGMPTGYGMPCNYGNYGQNNCCYPQQCGGNQQQMQMMMMQMQMMMMMMQMMQMNGMNGFPNMMFPNTAGMNNFMGTQACMPALPPYGHSNPLPPFAAGAPNINPMMFNNQMGGSAAGNQIAQTALQWQGQQFKPGQTCRCADFVSTVLRQSGAVGPNFRHQVSCSELQRQGQPVPPDQMKPGDVVFFGNTYRRGQYTHTGIYLGNGQFAHRNTAGGPVKVDRMDRGYYANHFTGARRMA